MTYPIPENPYGVSVPHSRTRLPWMPAPLVDDHPLVPWAEDVHAGQWVDVDHAQEQVREFELCLERLPEMILPEVDLGHLFVVTGPVGMGKTTLIHRCVHLTKQRLAQLAALVPQPTEAEADTHDFIMPPTELVVMTGGYDNVESSVSYDDQGQFASTRAINTAIRKAIVEKLNERFPEAAKDPALAGDDLGQSFRRISTLLAEQDRLLLVIVPHMRWLDHMGAMRTEFLRTCLRHARSRIVLFVEVRHEDPDSAHEVVAELPPHPALTHLKLGSLSPEDTVKFSQSARADHPDPDAPDGPRDPDAWSRSDVRQLRKVYFDLAERQRRSGLHVLVTAADLPEPVPDLASMTRRPAAPSGRPPAPRQGS